MECRMALSAFPLPEQNLDYFRVWLSMNYVPFVYLPRLDSRIRLLNIYHLQPRLSELTLGLLHSHDLMSAYSTVFLRRKPKLGAL